MVDSNEYAKLERTVYKHEIPAEDEFPYVALGRAVVAFNDLESALIGMAASMIAPFGGLTHAVLSEMSSGQVIGLIDRAAGYGAVPHDLESMLKHIRKQARELNKLRNEFVHARAFNSPIPMVGNTRESMRPKGGRLEFARDVDYAGFEARCLELANKCSAWAWDFKDWWREHPPRDPFW